MTDDAEEIEHEIEALPAVASGDVAHFSQRPMVAAGKPDLRFGTRSDGVGQLSVGDAGLRGSV
jgi:hypothetical protein